MYAVGVNRGRLEDLTSRQLGVMILLTLYHGFTSMNIDNAAHIGGLAARYFTRYLIISETQALHGLRYMKIKNLHAIVQGKKRRRLTWWMNHAYFAK